MSKGKKLCTREKNLSFCNCTYSCDKRGLCCECIAHHRDKDQLPACYFPEDEEKTYDRSIENFIKIWQKRKK